MKSKEKGENQSEDEYLPVEEKHELLNKSQHSLPGVLLQLLEELAWAMS